jgi:hypothetical protein
MPTPKFGYGMERGSILLMVLMMFFLVSFLSVATIELGLMEFKSSHYDFQAGQAQQAVDAGVDWGLEKIYAELTLPANLMAPSLPSRLACSSQIIYLDVGGKTCEVRIGEVMNISNQSTAPDSCTYEFTSTGIFEGAYRKVTVQAIYYFNGGYQDMDSYGNILFMPREYLNRGKIISYQNAI